VENEFDFCARRAAEEFMAAGRATSAAERKVHRQLAERYAEVVRQLMQKRSAGLTLAPPMPALDHPIDPANDAQAA
jgi:hypothetical protein